MLTISDGILLPLGWFAKCDIPSPEVQTYAEQVPGKDGEYYFGSNYGPRVIPLELTSPRLTKDTKEAEHQKLMDTFKEDVTVSYEGVFFKGRVSPEIDAINLPHCITATVPLKLLDPFLWDENELTTNDTIENKGNMITYPIIGIYNATNPTITIGESTLSYTGTCVSLVIDCEKQTAKDNGVNVIHNISGDYPLIKPGQIVNVESPNSFKVTWKNRYL